MKKISYALREEAIDLLVCVGAGDAGEDLRQIIDVALSDSPEGERMRRALGLARNARRMKSLRRFMDGFTRP